MDWTWLVLLVMAGLATFRITRLIVRDDFPLVRIPREWVVGGSGDGGIHEGKHIGKWYEFFGELISCHWCASGWVSLGITVGLTTNHDAGLVDWVLFWWATWAIGSVVADKAG